ncbi:MAG: hypothetical protein U0441_19590 [Polyangiaceae bacterium]
MDPLTPVSGVSLEKFADVSADVAVTRGDPIKIGEALGKASVSSDDWALAHAGWSERLADPAIGAAIAGPFEVRYHAALDKLLGPPPDVPPEDFAAMLGEALMQGLPAMGQSRRVDPLTWSRISFRARAAAAAEPGRLVALLALAQQIAERRLSGAVPEPPAKAFEQDATVAAKAVGKAVLSGLGAFGSAVDSLGKQLLSHSVGAPVLVTWSDGKKYPGTVAQVGKGQYQVTMADGSQHWIPEAFVKSA